MNLASKTPLASLSALRRHFQRLGITRRDVDDAITRARRYDCARTPRRREKLEGLRELRGKVALRIDVNKARKRRDH